jgi:hypothetical protein
VNDTGSDGQQITDGAVFFVRMLHLLPWKSRFEHPSRKSSLGYLPSRARGTTICVVLEGVGYLIIL